VVADERQTELQAIIGGCRAREGRVTSAVGQFIITQTQMKITDAGWAPEVESLSMVCLWAFSGEWMREDYIHNTPLEEFPAVLPEQHISSVGRGGRVGYSYSSYDEDVPSLMAP
jgi:hypothetical protein